MFMPRATLHLPLFSGHIRNSCLPVANPFTSSSVALYTVGYYRSLYFQRGPTASRWKTETGSDGGGTGCSPYICCYMYYAFLYLYTVCLYKGNRARTLVDRTDRTMEGKRGRFLLSASLCALDTRPRLSSPALLPLQLIRFFIRGHWHRVGLLLLRRFLLLFDGIHF